MKKINDISDLSNLDDFDLIKGKLEDWYIK